jgi:hypothetical protein
VGEGITEDLNPKTVQKKAMSVVGELSEKREE